jgi:hypothetical protein
MGANNTSAAPAAPTQNYGGGFMGINNQQIQNAMGQYNQAQVGPSGWSQVTPNTAPALGSSQSQPQVMGTARPAPPNMTGTSMTGGGAQQIPQSYPGRPAPPNMTGISMTSAQSYPGVTSGCPTCGR